jgi:hypothetical protein
MKKTIYTLIAMIGFANVSLAQCGTIMVNSGKLQYPDTLTNLPIAFQDSSYSTTIQTFCPVLGFGSFTLNSLSSFSIVGLPDSFSFSMYPSSGIITANTSGCIKIISSKVIAPIGSFPIQIKYITNYANGNQYSATASGYLIRVKVPVSLTTSVVNVNCLAKTSGSITLNAKGGFPPYQYAINNGPFQSSNVFVNLPIGTYTSMVKDSLNNIVQQNDTIKSLQGILSQTMVGPTSVATGATANYAVGQQIGYSYAWEITNGVITSGQGTNSAQVVWAQFKGAGNIKVKVTSPTTGCIDTAGLYVTIGTTGISNTSPTVNALKVYPNPASTILHIDLERPGNYTAKLSSVAGQSIISPTTGTVDISALANGVYILTIYDSNNKLISTNKVAILK